MPNGEAIGQFAASMHLVVDLADKYPRDSWRFPTLALSFARRETDTNAKRKHNRAKRDTSGLE